MMTTSVPKHEALSRKSDQSDRAFVRPVYRVDSDEQAYTVVLEMPGVRKESVDVHFDNQLLTITGRRDVKLPDGWKPLHRESTDTDYRLRLQVGVDIDSAAVSARLEDGVLTLRLPLAETSKPRQIEIH